MESRGSKPSKHRRASRPVQSGERSAEARSSVGADQHKRFIETARQLECDEDKERFEEKLGKIAKAKPKPAAKSLEQGEKS